MSIATYDTAPTAAVANRPAAATVSAKPGFWSRIFDRVVDARVRQAEQYLARHRHLLDTIEPPYAKGSRVGTTER